MWWGVGRTLLAALTHATTSIKVYGAERIPREGGAVLAVNHIHWIDIPVIGATCPRRISYLAKAEVDAVPFAGAFIRSFGTLFVRRGESDRDAVRLAREAVRNNLLLGMFVEGTRQRQRPARRGEARRCNGRDSGGSSRRPRRDLRDRALAGRIAPDKSRARLG